MSEIDATEELDRIDGDRGNPDLGEKRRLLAPGWRIALGLLLMTGGIITAFGIYHGSQLLNFFTKEETAKNAPSRATPTPKIFPTTPPPSPGVMEAQAATIEEEPEPPAEAEEPPETPQLPPYGQQATVSVEVTGAQSEGPTQAELVHQRRLSSPLSDPIAVSSDVAQIPVSGEGEGGFFGGGESTGVAGRLQPLRLQTSTAGMLPDRNYLITQGTQIGCVLETRIISTVPGLVVCRVTNDIWSESGNGILIDKGSKVVGQYSQGPDQGEERMFITWNRLIRPDGADIPIDSPAAGALGESGVPGSINNHYLKRFGGAVLLSLLDDVFKAIGRSATQVRGDGNQISFTGTADTANGIAEKALESTINIRPTLTLNQGSLLSIIVARDLDFSEVDSFEPIGELF